jgi:hypothetical protein
MSAVALQKGNKRYEGVYIEDKWITFDGFYSDNIGRYYRAKKKWNNYKRITPINETAKFKPSHINFIRKVKSLGYTKKNTCFTSASDRMKYHKTSRKIVLESRVLGTRDVKNILEKKGVEVSGINIISQRMRNGLSPFMNENRMKKFTWKGKHLPLHAIAKKENIILSLLRNKIFGEKMSLEKAVDYCRSYKPPTYLFEGEKLLPNEICKILSDRTGIRETTLRSRFYKWGYDLNKLVIEKSINKNAPYPKIVIAEKGNEKIKFNSIREAANKLGISFGNLSDYANGKRKGKLKGYTFSLCPLFGEEK